MNWCLTHNCPTDFEIGDDRLKDCVIVACRPDDDWLDTVSEPSPAELAQMDASAEELRLQFE